MLVLNIPGWKNSREGHWQTIWEADDSQLFKRVQQKNWLYPERDAWIREIKKTVESYPHEAILITAHSIGCMAFVHAVNVYGLRIKGALLVAPSDPEQPSYPKEITGFCPVPLHPLSFPSIVVASTDDRAVTLSRARYFASSWGSDFIALPNAGHIDQNSGFGKWQEGRAMLAALF